MIRTHATGTSSSPGDLGFARADPSFIADPYPVLHRAPEMALLETPAWKPTHVLRGLESLPVRL